jgi:hypothetical protein
MLLRLALSKLALKMYCTPAARQASSIARPISRPISSDSSTHGPAMTVSGWSCPMVTVPALQCLVMAQAYVRRRSA